jgi:hypothetical protein
VVGVLTLAYQSYQGAETTVVIIPIRARTSPGREDSPVTDKPDRSHAELRAPGERANAQLKTGDRQYLLCRESAVQISLSVDVRMVHVRAVSWRVVHMPYLSGFK